MTVDWENWLTKTDAEQKALWAQYRAIVAAESYAARQNNYARMWAAIWRIGRCLALLAVLLPVFALAEPVPRARPCINPDDLARVRAIMLDAMDAGLKQHAIHIYDNWLKDPSDQPMRAQRGMRDGIAAYVHSRAAVLAWSPPACGGKS